MGIVADTLVIVDVHGVVSAVDIGVAFTPHCMTPSTLMSTRDGFVAFTGALYTGRESSTRHANVDAEEEGGEGDAQKLGV